MTKPVGSKVLLKEFDESEVFEVVAHTVDGRPIFECRESYAGPFIGNWALIEKELP